MTSSGPAWTPRLELAKGRRSTSACAGAQPIEDPLPSRAADRRSARSRARAGHLHRDLKPANVKVSDRRTSSRCSTSVSRRRCDADVSQARPVAVADVDREEPRAIGVILGTAAYMSPRAGARAKRSIDGLTCGRLAACSTRCSPAAARSKARSSPRRWRRCCAASRTGAHCRLRRRARSNDCSAAACRRIRASGCKPSATSRIEIKEAMTGRDDAGVATAPPAPPAKPVIGLMVAVAAVAAILAGVAAWMLKPSDTATRARDALAARHSAVRAPLPCARRRDARTDHPPRSDLDRVDPGRTNARHQGPGRYHRATMGSVTGQAGDNASRRYRGRGQSLHLTRRRLGRVPGRCRAQEGPDRRRRRQLDRAHTWRGRGSARSTARAGDEET